MQSYKGNFQDRNGNAIGGASIAITITATGATVTIYSDNGVTTQTNPITTDSDGEFSFYAANGKYTITATKSGVATQTWTNVTLFDPSDSTAAGDVGFIQSGAGAVATTVQDELRERISVTQFGASTTASAATNATAVSNAITYALLSTPHLEVCFPELIDITGYTITITKSPDYGDRNYLKLTGTGGGLKKTDSGFMFTAAQALTGDIKVRGMSFVSSNSAGTKIWDCNKIMRINSAANEYYNVDTIAYQDSTTSGYLMQSCRFTHEKIIGGRSSAFKWLRASDCSFQNCLVENRESFIENIQDVGADVNLIQNHNIRVTDNCVEGNVYGSACVVKWGNSWGCTISRNYIESNLNYFDLNTLVRSAHFGLIVENNAVYLSGAQNTVKSCTYNQAASTTITLTLASHGLTNGQGVNINFTSGTAPDGSYIVSNVTTNTFDITSSVSTTTSGNASVYYAPFVVGNLSTLSTSTVRSHTSNFSSNVSDGELFCFVGTGILNSNGDYAASQYGFNNKDIIVHDGSNTVTTTAGNAVVRSGVCTSFQFNHTETNVLAGEVRVAAIAFTDAEIRSPILLGNMYQVYPAQIASGINILGIYPLYASGSSGTLYVTIENRSASTVASAILTVLVYQNGN